MAENSIDFGDDLMDNILYWIAYYWVEETVIPESTDETCLSAIQEFLEQQRK